MNAAGNDNRATTVLEFPPEARAGHGGGSGGGQRPPGGDEEGIQRAVVELLERAHTHNVEWTHIPNGERRPPGVGGKLKAMGVTAGWPDLLLMREGIAYGLELKTRTGKLSPVQTIMVGRLREAGMRLQVAYGLDDAIEKLRIWGLIRAK